ncbi:MAG: pyridoxamine 5'-phosphate oxidase family protein [Candidatus Aegiribacteria sp.]|nr:pyridoxamine 5'-phosphate oxidase family protein [Candidatus Aegiribacteria sp.]
MNRFEILEFVRRNTTSFMATAEGGEPRVRGMDTPYIDENGLTFCTGTGKDICKQLLANSSVELCYWSMEEKIQLRIRGEMEKLDDEELKKHIVETKFTFLKPVVEQFGWDTLTLFRISSGEARTWSPENPAEINTEGFDF